MAKLRTLVAAVLLAAWGVALPGPAPAAAASPEATYTFTGGGYGHGVGMSQWGARGYAGMGWDAGRILAHYYPGSGTVPRPSPALRIWLSDRAGSTTFTTSGPLPVNSDGATGTVLVDSTAPGSTAVTVSVDGQGRLSMAQNGSVVAGPVTGTLLVSPEAAPSSTCTVGSHRVAAACLSLSTTGRQYHFGVVEFSAAGGSVRTVVRDLPMQRYLYGLAEVPASWPHEALRAQAVAGRTYALSKALRTPFRTECSCTLRSTTSDQVYGGLTPQADPVYGPRWVNAVRSIGDAVSSVDGSTPIQALYSASSGGWTESNQGAFGSSPVSYLQTVRDLGDGVAENPWRSWTRAYTGAQLSRWLAASSATSVGTLQDIVVPGYTSAQRPSSLVLVGSTATRTVSAATFRSVVSSGAAAAGAPFLPGTRFQLAVNDPAAAPCTTGPVAAPTTDLPLVHRSTTWYQRTSYTAGPAEGCFTFGAAGDLPVTGDWNGDDRATAGVFRPSTGTWHLRNGTGGGPADAGSLRYGAPGDKPVVGDWNGDGTPTPGVFRPTTATWYLTDTVPTPGATTPGTTHHLVRYGSPDDLPVAGDWNGDGTTGLGVHRSGAWHLRDTLTSGAAQTTVPFGSPGDTPVVGDWNHDGTDTLAVVRRGTWHLTNTLSGPATATFVYGAPTDSPLTWG